MKFLDTNALLKEIPKEKFLISSITLDELENIKTSSNKDAEVKYNARKTLRKLDSGEVDYEVIIYNDKMLKPIVKAGIEITPDTKIIACAIAAGKDTEFITNDLSCKTIAKMFLKNVSSIGDNDEEEYTGYVDIQMTDEEMCDFYSDLSDNKFGLLINEYLIVRDSTGAAVDIYCWTGIEHRRLKTHSFFSDYFGEVKAIKGDIYQKMATDSLVNNKLTMMTGPAGSGKSMLSLGYLMSQLEGGKIDKIIIFANPAASRNSVRLGFTPGDLNTKILDTQVGSMLIGKFGDRMEVERLVNEEKIMLLSFSNLRGFDTSGMNAGIYISEAQNLDRELIKLAIQRIGEDCIMIIEGDNEQVDDNAYAGNNNGMRRVSEVFRGENIYGQVRLNKVHRSKMAMLAEKI